MSGRRVFVVVEEPFVPEWLKPRRPRVSGSGLEPEVEELLFPRPSSPGAPHRRAFFFALGLLLAVWFGFLFGGAELEAAALERRFDSMFRDLRAIEAAGRFQ